MKDTHPTEVGMRKNTLRSSLVIAALVTSGAVGAACSKKEEPPREPRTAEEQRRIDSTIGASALPGAHGVQGAMKAADSAAARKKLLDSIANAP
jgi:hypothetical protein